MALESVFQRLSIRRPPVCSHCRRTFAASAYTAQQRQPQSATGAFAELLQASRANAARVSRPLAARSSNAAASTSSPAASAPSTTSTISAPQRTSWEIAAEAVRTAAASRSRTQEEQRLGDLERQYTRRDLEQQVHRRFRVGDVYAPHDLSGVEMNKWRPMNKRNVREKVRRDVIDQLGINPIDHYKNFSIMSEYISDMGRIKHSRETGLRPVNQRRMAKAIRRAMGTGLLMPGTYRHPEILRMEANVRARRVR